MHRGKNHPARADDESRTSYGGATTSQGHQHGVHGTGGVTPRGGRSNPRTSPRGVPVMGFGQTVNRGVIGGVGPRCAIDSVDTVDERGSADTRGNTSADTSPTTPRRDEDGDEERRGGVGWHCCAR